MIIIISLLLLGSLLPNLSFTASVNVRIVNGTKATPHSRPYMVSVQKYGKHECGGFLISDQFVLTAAHCRNDTEILTVVAGAHDLSNRQEKNVRIGVSTYNIHPLYKTNANAPFMADLMILELVTNVQLNNNIQTIPIPKTPVEISVGTACSVAGWGRIENDGPLSPTLREANVEIMNNTVCAAQWGWEYVAPQMMCVHDSGGSCFGDSGGPLVCDNIAVGVTSFVLKNSCNDPHQHNVYMKISAFLPWIKEIVSPKCGDKLTVVVGAHELNRNSPLIAVKFYHIHPGYDSAELLNDIMILQRNHQKQKKNVKLISIPKKDKNIKANTKWSVAGWGKQKTNGSVSKQLMEVDVKIIDSKECQKYWKGTTSRMVCAFGEGGFCQGDSGGPLVCDGIAVGVVSFNEKNNCDKPTRPKIYTRISKFLTWINAILGGVKQDFDY
ncbi:cathepsin G-like [Paramisgurnus dabryanus]|uniref:cathepsin G-like n=1 Tax=Paramisgurnus dabryanus TaxID=90735 RepID=UPI0031F38653